MINEKILKWSYYLLMSLIIIIGLFFWGHDQYVGRKDWKRNYKKLSFNGVIKDSIHIIGQGDLPTYVFTNNSSHFSDINEEYMQQIAKEGDSLSKINGTDTVFVFRKNYSGRYIKIYP